MSITIATSPYQPRFGFGYSQTGSSESSAKTAVSARATAQSPSVVAASTSSSLSTTLDRTGFIKGGVATQGSEAVVQNKGSDQNDAKLQSALSTLIGALGPASAETGVQDAIKTIRGALSPSTSAAPRSAGAEGRSTATDAVKPNLDSLNRVLSHYTAQSAASSTVLSLVD